MLRVNDYFDHVYVINIKRLRYRYEMRAKRFRELGIEHERLEGIDGLDLLPEPEIISGNLFYKTNFEISTKTSRYYRHNNAGNVSVQGQGLYLLSIRARHHGFNEVGIRYYLNNGGQTLRYGTSKVLCGGSQWHRLAWEVYIRSNEKFDSINFMSSGDFEICKPELLQTDHSYAIARGMVGCNLSHALAVRDAREKGYHRILCFEDDVLFHHNFTAAFARVTPHIPDDWQLLYLGGKQRAKYWKEINVQEPGWYRAVECNGLHAYGINSVLYDEFIATVETWAEPVDLAVHRFQCEYPCYVMFPNLIIANEFESSTQEKSPEDAKRVQEASRWDLSLYA